MLRSKIDSASDYGANPLVPGEWTQVYIGILYGKEGLSSAVVHVNGIKDSNPSVRTSGPAPIFSNLDVLTVGNGFNGHIRRFQIYSPGALEIGPNSCDSTCAIHLGFAENPVCVQPICGKYSGTYYSFGSCESNFFRKKFIPKYFSHRVFNRMFKL